MKISSSSLKPTVKWSLVALAAFQIDFAAWASLGGADEPTRVSWNFPGGTVIALNHDVTLGGKLLPKGSELVISEDGALSLVETGKDGAADGELAELDGSIIDLYNLDYTVLEQDEFSGEVVPYNIPEDFTLAGPGRARRRRGGVTNCYHVVKQIVRRRISLTGVAAYMAAPQLRAANWRHYGNYESAPRGSVCVFAAGGTVTSSGGHIYGHIGVKGAGGIANPSSGFHLKRPFLGCWNER